MSSVKPRHLPWRAPAILAVAVAAAPLLAHDDDPKLRDRRPPVDGRGYRRGLGPILPAAGTTGGTQEAGGFDSDGVTLEAWLPLNVIDGSDTGNDCWGYTSPSGREYAILGTSDGTNFIEVTTPNDPVIVDFINGPDSLWRDVKVYQDHAYAVSEGGSGIQVMSMANIDNGNVSLVNTVSGPGSSATHNVAIDTDSGFLYRLGGDGLGMRIYSLANPANPSFVAQWHSRYVHDAQVVTYTQGPNAGKQIVFACGGLNGGFDSTGLTVIDVTNKGNIQVLDQVFYPNPGYSHQGWLSPDRQYFYLGDELDEDGGTPSTTHVFNVSNLSNVGYVGAFDNGNFAITHNLYTLGSTILAANYTSGLRVFDATNPTNPQEVGYFDTYPGGDPISFNGLWSVYPYFPSGTVIGSDLDRGFFVWTVGDPPIAIDIPGGPPTLIDPDGQGVPVTITEQNPGDLMPGSAKLYYDSRGGYTSVAMVDNGGGNFSAQFPPIACDTSTDWYLEAQDSTGKAWTNPGGAPASASHESLVADGLNVTADHDMETGAGWSGGAAGDNATTGVWVRVNPNGTAAQPEDDHTPGGTQCWVTGQGSPGGSVGENDVDGGKTTLLSPNYDMSALSSPSVSYWRWYSNTAGNAPNADVFRIDVSNNGGNTWTSVEVIGPAGIETSGGWYQHTFKVEDLVTPTANVRLRFVAEDAGEGSIVEAAIDDLQVFETVCDLGPGSNYCSTLANSTGQPAVMSAMGTNVVADNDVTLMSSQMPSFQPGYYIASETQGFVINPPGSQGILCLGGGILRYSANVLDTGASGSFSLQIDLGQLPPPDNGSVLPGETWNFQAWFRDANPGPTSNFTDGYSILFQ